MENGKSETGGVSIFPNFRCGSFTEWTIEKRKVVKTNPVQVLQLKKGEQHPLLQSWSSCPFCPCSVVCFCIHLSSIKVGTADKSNT